MNYETRKPTLKEMRAPQWYPHEDDPNCDHPHVIRWGSTNGYFDRCTRCGAVLEDFEWDW